MRPAFSSTKEAAAFAGLLLFLLTAPWLSSKGMLPQPSQTYSSESIRWELFPWVQKYISNETNDIDIAFIGSSHIGFGLDPEYVQRKLDERLGRKTVVRTLTFTYPGFDALYYVTKDLLAHRHVRTLVFYDECSQSDASIAHPDAPQWFRYGESRGEVSSLPLRYRAVYYFAAVLGMPRNLLESLVSNLPLDSNSQLPRSFFYLHAANPESTLGCIGAHLGFDPSGGLGNTNFTAYVPQARAVADDVCLYSPTTASHFVFADWPLPASQTYFARQFGLMAKSHGCNLVALHVPMFDDRASTVVTESRHWSDLLQTDVCLMAIPGRRLFAGLKEQEIERLFFNPTHLNENGQKFFTPLITPALLQFYESHPNH